MIVNEVLYCKLIQRPNRFTVIVEVNGETSRAYNTNTGRLEELIKYGNIGVCSRKKGGKLRYFLHGVITKKGVAIIDTQLQMKVFEKTIEKRAIDWLKNCYIKKRNPRVKDSVLDYLLSCNNKDVYLEIKSAVLEHENGLAGYPDCPSLRGRRHIMTLTRLSLEGEKTMILFIAAIPGVRGFSPYDKGDPMIRGLLRKAAESGVIVRAISIFGIREKGLLKIYLGEKNLPVLL